MHRRTIEGKRFALLADTHDNLVDWPAALGAITKAAGAVDGFIHCGDLSTPRTLDTLAEIAPVWAVRAKDDPPADDDRLVDGGRVLDVGDVRVGVVFSLVPGAGAADALFGERVDVCVFGGTHAPAIVAAGGTVYVNPGSPTLAKKRSLGIMSVDNGCASLELVAIE